MHNKTDNEMIYESLNQSGIAYDQQQSKGNKYRPQVGKGNYNQFSGLNTSLKTNAGAMPSFGGISDEEIGSDEDTIEVKGYGVMTIQQLKQLIERRSNEISQSIADGNLDVGNKADILKLFADTYSRRNNY
jgi:hypothetical protein